MISLIFVVTKTLLYLLILASRIAFWLLRAIAALIKLIVAAIYQAITKKQLQDADDLENWETAYDYGCEQDFERGTDQMFRRKRQRKWLPLAVAMMFGSFSFVSTVGMGTTFAQAAEPEVLVVVDAGHYTGYNPGVAAGYTEGDWSMRQARADKTALESYGFQVVLTRDENSNPGLYDRGQMAVKAGQAGNYAAVVFMSDHTDACEYDSSVSGVSAITSAHLSNSNMQLIQSVMQSVADEMNFVTGVTGIRGIETRMNPDGTDYYGVLRGAVSGATSPSEAANKPVQYAFILEHGFHTNPAECLYMTTDSHIQAVAQAKARAFAAFFGKATKSPSESIQNQTTRVSADVPCTPWTGTVRISGDTLNLRSGNRSEDFECGIPKHYR